ncbi:MAG: glycosyltransferase family 4 protein [Cellulomonas sp.]
MRVLLDATAIPVDRGGVGRYVEDLLPALTAAGVDLVVACQARDVSCLNQAAPEAEVVPVAPRFEGRGQRLAWEQALLPALVRRTGVELLHSPHYTAPMLSHVPTVVTLHDATFFSHPDLHSSLKGHFFRAAIRTAVRRAGSIVVPSAATRDEVLRFAGGSRDRFFVAPHGVDPAVFHPVGVVERERVAQTLGVQPRSYIAFLGTLEPRKNVPTLVRAWVRAVAHMDQPPALVLAGGPGWDDDVPRAIAEVPSHLRVIRTGYLPLGDLCGLLSGACVVAYPSLGEGFGLPVLEAMACGATVMTTRELSLPEVGGDAVAYTGSDEASMAVGLAALLGDEGRRADLAARAQVRAATFSWESSARAHIRAYDAAVLRHAPAT